MSEPTQTELAYLRSFSPDSYASELPTKLALQMESKGWVRWVPPVLGTCWAITDKGREIALAKPTGETA